jgi:hypothetical protein
MKESYYTTRTFSYEELMITVARFLDLGELLWHSTKQHMGLSVLYVCLFNP